MLQLTLDSGLLVLIWCVQLVIYPSFRYIDQSALIVWHSKYMKRLAVIVLPLMLGQLGVCAFLLIRALGVSNVIQATLVTLIWIHTFVRFVPFHGKIGQNSTENVEFRSIIAQNWVRTVFWTIIFILTIIDLFL